MNVILDDPAAVLKCLFRGQLDGDSAKISVSLYDHDVVLVAIGIFGEYHDNLLEEAERRHRIKSARLEFGGRYLGFVDGELRFWGQVFSFNFNAGIPKSVESLIQEVLVQRLEQCRNG